MRLLVQHCKQLPQVILGPVEPAHRGGVIAAHVLPDLPEGALSLPALDDEFALLEGEETHRLLHQHYIIGGIA